jgi:hypothetical protein
MTLHDFQALMDGLAPCCPVRPSARIEDAVDIEVDDTLVSVQWSEGSGLLELTLTLPVVIDGGEHPQAQLALYRALLQRHWLETGGDAGIGFGLMPSSDEVVGMATLDGATVPGPDAFLDAVQLTLASAIGEWLGVCGQILMQQVAAAGSAPEEGVAPPSPPLLPV